MAEPWETLFDKLVLMKWVDSTMAVDGQDDRQAVQIRFSDLGKTKITSLAFRDMIAEIQRVNGPLTAQEISVVKGLPMLVAQQLQGGPKSHPNRGYPRRA